MKYTVDYFIDKLSAIPEDKWTTRAFTRNDKHCAMGHCGGFTEEGMALDKLTYFNLGFRVTIINDGTEAFLSFENETIEELKLLGNTPKERVLHALELIKAGVSIWPFV